MERTYLGRATSKLRSVKKDQFCSPSSLLLRLGIHKAISIMHAAAHCPYKDVPDGYIHDYGIDSLVSANLYIFSSLTVQVSPSNILLVRLTNLRLMSYPCPGPRVIIGTSHQKANV